jgi:hypothetical protein
MGLRLVTLYSTQHETRSGILGLPLFRLLHARLCRSLRRPGRTLLQLLGGECLRARLAATSPNFG